MITLEEKLLQGYKHKHLSFDKNEHKCEEVKALNPRLQVRYRPVPFMISYDCIEILLCMQLYFSDSTAAKLLF